MTHEYFAKNVIELNGITELWDFKPVENFISTYQ